MDWQDFRKKSPEVPESSVHPWGGGSGLAAVSGGYPAQRKNTVKGNADSQQGTVESADFADNRILFLLVLAVVFCGPIQQLMPRLKARLFDEENVTAADAAVMAALLLLGTLLMVSSTYQAFIYFRF